MKNRVLYYWQGACPLAAHIVLEESGPPFDAIKVDFSAGKRRTPEYLATDPHGRVPALRTSWGVLTEDPAAFGILEGARRTSRMPVTCAATQRAFALEGLALPG